MGSFNFEHNIESQNIFHRWFDGPTGAGADVGCKGNKIALAANKDLFVAVENTIRCCTINSKSNNYKLISTKFEPFDIEEIGLNPQETFLYSTDFKRVIVQNFPGNINESKSLNRSTSQFELTAINGDVLKIVWSPFVANGLSLVLLTTDGRLLYYDLNISCQPLMIHDLRESDAVKDEKVTSVSFGSSTNLIGGLTLYLTTASSKIYAILPLIYKDSILAVTKEEIEVALGDSKSALQMVTKAFPDATDDNMTESIQKQISFFLGLIYEAEGGSPSAMKGKGQMCHHLRSNFKGICEVQGPLANLQMGKIQDICNIGNNSQCAALVAINDDKSDITIKYLSQITPLIMQLDSGAVKQNLAQIEAPGVKQIEPSTKKSPASFALGGSKQVKKEASPVYRAPSVGFGYVEDVEEETIGSSDEISTESEDESDPVSGPISKPDFWKKFIVKIDEIGIEIVSGRSLGDYGKIIPSNIDFKRFFLYSPKKTLVCTMGDWISYLPSSIDEEMENSYNFIDNEGDGSNVTLIKDDITFTGDYLINFLQFGKKPAQVFKISKAVQDLALQFGNLKVEDSKDTKSIIESKLSSNLITELDNDIKSLNETSLTKHKIQSTDSSIDALDHLNKFSIESLRKMAALDKIIMKLSLKISASIIELKYQRELVEDKQSSGSGDANSEKLVSLIANQKRIQERMDQFHSKLARKVEEFKIRNKIPLSDKEKEWFEEINSVIATTSGENGLVQVVENLKSQVKYIKQNINVKDVEEIQNSKELKDLKTHVSSSFDTLRSLRDQIDELSKKEEMAEERK